MTKIAIQTYTTARDHSIFIMRLLLAGCFLAASWYGMNVYAAISNTIAAEHISAEADAIGNSINQLDAQYISLANSASPSALSAYGLSQGSVSVYIQRGASLGSVAYSGHEL
jgi:hypothetical protein